MYFRILFYVKFYCRKVAGPTDSTACTVVHSAWRRFPFRGTAQTQYINPRHLHVHSFEIEGAVCVYKSSPEIYKRSSRSPKVSSQLSRPDFPDVHIFYCTIVILVYLCDLYIYIYSWSTIVYILCRLNLFLWSSKKYVARSWPTVIVKTTLVTI